MNRLTRRHPTHPCLIIQYPRKTAGNAENPKGKVQKKSKGNKHIYKGKFVYNA